MDADDRMVARVVLNRFKRIAHAAFGMGAVAAALGVLPHLGVPLPVALYGICSVIPLVLGGCAIAGALLALRTPRGQSPGVAQSLRTMGLGFPRALVVVAIVLGSLGGLSGLLSLAFMELA